MNISVEKDYLVIDGNPRFIFGGDFSYGRTPRSCWRDRINKMKTTGMNCITFYCVWCLHERKQGKYDFSENHDLAAFIDMIHDAGMYTIFRMGPFVHGEYRNGGLPQWLIDKLGARVRTNDPEYLEISARWYQKLIEIAKPRLITNGGPIILLQLENELGAAGCKGDDIPRGSGNNEENVNLLRHYHNLIKEAGIDVPVIDINKVPNKDEIIDNLVDSGGGYPVNCFGTDGDLSPFDVTWWNNHTRPKITIETGCAMMSRFIDTPAYRHTNSFQGPIVEPEIVEAFVQQTIAEGANGVNVFVFNDGQHYGPFNEGMTAEANMNYQAPITAYGTLRKSYKCLKRIGWFVRAFEQELLRSQPNEKWARATSYGIATPGVESGGDLFEGYDTESEIPDNIKHVKTVSVLGRTTTGLNLSESNFLFMRNTSHYGTHWLRDIRILTTTNKLACEVNQEYPKRVQLELPPQVNKIVPFFVKLADKTFLEYSTASLLDRRQFGSQTQLILYGTREETLETRIVSPCCDHIKTTSQTLALKESPNTTTLISSIGAEPEIATIDSPVPVRYVLMDQEMAGEVWDVQGEKEILVTTSDLRLLNSSYVDKDKRTNITAEITEPDFYFYLFSPKALSLTGPFREFQGKYDEDLQVYKATGSIDLQTPEIVFHKRKEGADYIWEADLNPEMLNDLNELILRCEFDGFYGRAWLDDQLISDHPFGGHLFWEIGLKHWLKKKSSLKIQFEKTRTAHLTVKPVVQKQLTINWA